MLGGCSQWSPPRHPPGECSISPRAAASASWPWPPPYIRAKLMLWQVWQSPSLWGLQNPRSDYPSLSLQLFVVLIFTRVIVLQNRTQHPGGDRWPEQAGGYGQVEGPEGALLTALGSTAACLCLILPQSWLRALGVWVEPRKDCLSVRLLLCHLLSGSVSRCQAGVVTNLRREEMTTRNGSERPSILSPFSTRHARSLACECRGCVIRGMSRRCDPTTFSFSQWPFDC